tara:strand:+ start:1020 stop:1262 length:243 start_codon:yes stop_codon:yes gene_type:complete
MDDFTLDSLRLKAAIEFGSEYIYSIRSGGLGLTLYVDAGTKEASAIARRAIPSQWQGLYVLVLSSGGPLDETPLYDPNLT